MPTRDAAPHAPGLGFIVGMVMAHAPVILPAVAGVKVLFEAAVCAPLTLLHASLALRLALGSVDAKWLGAEAWLNVAALALLLSTMAGTAFASRHPPSTAARTP